jgi:hypothetical protein
MNGFEDGFFFDGMVTTDGMAGEPIEILNGSPFEYDGRAAIPKFRAPVAGRARLQE